MLTDEDITLNEDQLLDNFDDTNGDVDLEVIVREILRKMVPTHHNMHSHIHRCVCWFGTRK